MTDFQKDILAGIPDPLPAKRAYAHRSHLLATLTYGGVDVWRRLAVLRRE